MITQSPRLGVLAQLQALAASAAKAFVETFFEPLPPTPQAVFNLLRFMEAEGGWIRDCHDAEEFWKEELRDAARRGYVDPGDGWSYGTSLTPKGERALRENG